MRLLLTGLLQWFRSFFFGSYLPSSTATLPDYRTVFLLLLSICEGKATPIGTAICISNKFVLTAAHTLFDNLDLKRMNSASSYYGVTKSLNMREIGVDDIVRLDRSTVAFNQSEDWAVLARLDGNFDSTVSVCSESRLQAPSHDIVIMDYPIDLFSSNSSTSISIASINSNVTWYEENQPTETTSKTQAFGLARSVKVVEGKCTVDSSIRSVVVVRGGHVLGSCGAPYFTSSGEVFALHFESIDDSDDRSMSSNRNHQSYSRGYVLCRLKSFKHWYSENVAQL